MVFIISLPTKTELWDCGYQFTIIPHNLALSCWSHSLTSLGAFFPSAERVAKENSQEDWPGVSWAGVQGLIMESVSHKQNSVNSDSGSNASKEFGGNWKISSFCLLYFLVIHLSDHIPGSFCPGLKYNFLKLKLGSAGFMENRCTTKWIKNTGVIRYYRYSRVAEGSQLTWIAQELQRRVADRHDCSHHFRSNSDPNQFERRWHDSINHPSTAQQQQEEFLGTRCVIGYSKRLTTRMFHITSMGSEVPKIFLHLSHMKKLLHPFSV